MGARFVQGLAEGAVHPAFYAMAARWLPEGERASLVSLAMLGGLGPKWLPHLTIG